MSKQYPLEGKKSDKASVSTKCWLQLVENEKMIYLFQIEAPTEGILDEALGLIGGCITANGFDPKKGNMIVITKKIFKTWDEFQLFKADCPLDIELT